MAHLHRELELRPASGVATEALRVLPCTQSATIKARVRTKKVAIQLSKKVVLEDSAPARQKHTMSARNVLDGRVTGSILASVSPYAVPMAKIRYSGAASETA